MPRAKEYVVIGAGGHVVALDTATGAERWRTKLKGSDPVTIWDTGKQIYAGARGELFCLDSASGEILWHNKLKGLGLDMIAFGSTSDVLVAAAIKAARDAAGTSAVG